MTTFTTFDPATASVDVTLSNGNLTTAWASSGSIGGVKGFTIDALNTGKTYFEITFDTVSAGDDGAGILLTTGSFSDMDNNETNAAAIIPSGNLYVNGTNTGSIGQSISSGNVIAVAVDFDAGLIWMKNLTAGGNWNNSGSNDPATGVGGRGTLAAGSYVLAVAYVGLAAQTTFNTGATAFTGSVPSGFTSGWPTRRDTWASIETPDTFAAIGFQGIPGPHGEWVSIGAPDIFAAIGSPTAVGTILLFETPDRFSAFGFQPFTAVLSATEARDVMHATGLGLGVDGIFTVTEAVDIFTAVGNTPISGSFNATESPDRFSAIGAGVTRVRRRRIFIVT